MRETQTFNNATVERKNVFFINSIWTLVLVLIQSNSGNDKQETPTEQILISKLTCEQLQKNQFRIRSWLDRWLIRTKFF